VFYIERPGGHRVDVVVATTVYGNKYLKTTADSRHLIRVYGRGPASVGLMLAFALFLDASPV